MQTCVEQQYHLEQMYGLEELLLYLSKTKVKFMTTVQICLYQQQYAN